MSIDIVSAGTAATGNNTSVSPGAPAGVVQGHLVIIMASIRNSGTGTVNTPTGWSRLNPAGTNVGFFGRFWRTGDTIPTISFTGGVANADTIAQAFAFSGVEPTLSTIVVTELLNASAQNVAYPAATGATQAQQGKILAIWKQDDWTSVSTPSGFTLAGSSAPTAGDDAAQALYFQRTSTTVPAGSITVTGGAAAISRGYSIVVRRDAVVTTDPQPTWPPRVQVTVSPLVPGDTVALYRVVAGQRTLVRGGTQTTTDTFTLTLDAELPFGVPVEYQADVNGYATYSSSTVTYTLPGGNNAVTDAITGLAAEVVIQEWTTKRRDRRHTVFRTAAGRNVVVSGPLGQAQSNITLYTATTSAANNLIAVLAGATSGTVQIRQGTGATGVDSYQTITAVEEERYDTSTGTDEKRLWRLEAVETEAWAPSLLARGYTYADLTAYYTGLTYSNLQSDYTGLTYLNLRQAEF